MLSLYLEMEWILDGLKPELAAYWVVGALVGQPGRSRSHVVGDHVVKIITRRH